MQHDRCRRCVSFALFVCPMKLLTKTSIIFTGFEGIYGCRYCGITIVSNLCQGIVVFTFTNLDMKPLTFYDPTQKKGGYSQHPIFNAIGTTSSASSSDTGQPPTTGKTYQKFHAWICETTRRQNPLAMSILVNRKGKSRS